MLLFHFTDREFEAQLGIVLGIEPTRLSVSGVAVT